MFTPENARTYGQWLGQRYADMPIIWILGGDCPVESDTQRAVISAMAEGLRVGDGGQHLISFHPQGGQASSHYFHAQPWLDFNRCRAATRVTRPTGASWKMTTPARQPSRVWTRSLGMKTIPRPSSLKTATSTTTMCVSRYTGRCSRAHTAIPTAVTRSDGRPRKTWVALPHAA